MHASTSEYMPMCAFRMLLVFSHPQRSICLSGIEHDWARTLILHAFFIKKEVIVKPRTFLFFTFIFIVPVIRLTCQPRTFLLSFNKNEWNYRWRIKWSTKPNLTSHAYLSWNYFWFIFLLVAMFMVMVLMANTLMHIWNDD